MRIIKIVASNATDSKKGDRNMNIQKLRGKMVERGLNVETLAVKVGVDRSTLYRKFYACEKITIGEAQKIKDALSLTDDDAMDIFFG
jgi:AraC-like DNA-binding protein